MARTTPNLGLKVWNLPSDPFSTSELASNWDSLDAQFGGASVDLVPGRFMESGAALPGTDLVDGRLFYLTAAASGFSAKSLLRYDGSSWRVIGPAEIQAALPVSNLYAGRVIILSAAAGGFNAWDVVLYDGSAWKKLNQGVDVSAVVPTSGNYAGRVVVLSAPVNSGGYVFAAYDVIRFNGTSWHLIGPTTSANSPSLARVPGEIVLWGGPGNASTGVVESTTGWLLCNGAAVSTTTYAALFSAIGYTYGGSGGTFNLPNLRDKVPVGQGISGTFQTRGQIGGSETHTHTSPSHSHTTPAHTHSTPAHAHTVPSHTHDLGNHTHTVALGQGNDIYDIGNEPQIGVVTPQTAGSSGPSPNTSGGSGALSTDTSGASTTGSAAPTTDGAAVTINSSSNLSPYIVLNYIIKY